MLPFRIGATSYIIPDDILPNARHLAALGEVQDIELVLFEVDDGLNNIPSPETVAELAALAGARPDLLLHLPLDLRLGRNDESHVSIKAHKVIERTRPSTRGTCFISMERPSPPLPEREGAEREIVARSLARAANSPPSGPAARNGWPSRIWSAPLTTPVIDRVPVTRR